MSREVLEEGEGHQMVGKAELDVPAIDPSTHCSSASSLLHIRVFAGDFP
jgi:hypothetical protein